MKLRYELYFSILPKLIELKENFFNYNIPLSLPKYEQLLNVSLTKGQISALLEIMALIYNI